MHLEDRSMEWLEVYKINELEVKRCHKTLFRSHFIDEYANPSWTHVFKRPKWLWAYFFNVFLLIFIGIYDFKNYLTIKFNNNNFLSKINTVVPKGGPLDPQGSMEHFQGVHRGFTKVYTHNFLLIFLRKITSEKFFSLRTTTIFPWGQLFTKLCSILETFCHLFQL